MHRDVRSSPPAGTGAIPGRPAGSWPARGGVLLLTLLLAACAGAGRSGEPAPRASQAFETAAASAARTPEVQGVAVRSVEFEWHDTTRARTVPVRLYLPDPPGGPGTDARPLPLVVFSHGLGGSRAGYSHLGRHWAGRGFASLHLQHAGSDREVWRSDGTLGMLKALQAAASADNAIARARDVSFALDRLLADPALGPAIDASRIAIAGHSYGANTALLVAGARFDADGLPQTLRDDRIRAAVLMSAPPFPAGFDSRRVLAGVTIPTLHLTTVDDVIRVPGHRSVAQDRIDLYESLAATPRWLAVFGFGQHNVFTDRGVDPRAQAVKRAARDLSTAFLQGVLDARPQVLEGAFAMHAGLFSLTSARGSAGAGSASR
jgi:acetyl esterase/lipase